jgi:hypothetical protein
MLAFRMPMLQIRTPENVGQSSGFVEDALVVVFVGGDDVVGAEVFLGVEAGGFCPFKIAENGRETFWDVVKAQSD